MTLHIYSVVSLLAAAIMPPLSAWYMVWYCRKNLRRMDKRLAEMYAIQAGMSEMLAAPARIRQAAREIRDTITRVQEADNAEYPRQNGHSFAEFRDDVPESSDGNHGMDVDESRGE